MFQNLTERLGRTLKNLSGQGRLTEENIQETLREIRVALLEADVALAVIKQFIDDIKARAIGHEVMLSISPGQLLVKIVNEELTKVLGSDNAELNLSTRPPAVILMAGLQGSGKTTTVAKLALWLKNTQKKTVLVASADVYRPAAIAQLQTLAKEVDVNFFPSDNRQSPKAIAEAALAQAKLSAMDVLIIDTAGRLHIDQDMMTEIKELHQLLQPIESLFVVDSMTGQDAANTAKAFNEALPLTGVVLTKTDGDARGGAALSIRNITGKPIKFIGVGEKTTALEPFYPERMASRILGMGDIVSLVESAQQKLDIKEASKFAEKIKKGKVFDLEDFLAQIQQISQMGSMADIVAKLPGANMLPAGAKDQINDRLLGQTKAIICSMTRQERRFPALIRGSRKLRIAKGSGTQVQDINRLLKQFTQMQKMMKRVSKQGGLMKMMRGMKGMMPMG